jgi:hypothetical protein
MVTMPTSDQTSPPNGLSQEEWDKRRESLLDEKLDHDSRLRRRVTASIKKSDLLGLSATSERSADVPDSPTHERTEDEDEEDGAGEAQPTDVAAPELIDPDRIRLIKILAWSGASAALLFLLVAVGLGFGVVKFKQEAEAAKRQIQVIQTGITERDRQIEQLTGQVAKGEIERQETEAKGQDVLKQVASLQETIKDKELLLTTKGREVDLVNQDLQGAMGKLRNEIEARQRLEVTLKQAQDSLDVSEKARIRIKATYDELLTEAQQSRVSLSQQAAKLREIEGSERLLKEQLLKATKELSTQATTEAQLRKEIEDLRKSVLTGR